jgi:hypothetical protein
MPGPGELGCDDSPDRARADHEDPRLAGKRRRRSRIIAVREIRWCHVRGLGSGAGRAVETSLVKIRLYG